MVLLNSYNDMVLLNSYNDMVLLNCYNDMVLLNSYNDMVLLNCYNDMVLLNYHLQYNTTGNSFPDHTTYPFCGVLFSSCLSVCPFVKNVCMYNSNI
jgi:hypothetical protein